MYLPEDPRCYSRNTLHTGILVIITQTLWNVIVYCQPSVTSQCESQCELMVLPDFGFHLRTVEIGWIRSKNILFVLLQ
jgi:hypothetical protein